MPLTPGMRLGPYQVEAALGAGGMGEVYRALDTRLDRIVALKVLPPQLAERPEVRQRFEREARVISSLNHPHICTLYDIGSHDGIHFLVMEYLEGETLAARLGRGPLPIGQALQYAIQMTGALALAHRRGVFHRDLKPSNIMLVESGAKLLDFGLAKLAAAAPAASQEAGFSSLPTVVGELTLEGSILGTFQYMSPEQVESRPADARSDIFSFGAVLFEMLTGRKAFEGRSPASLMAAILEREPPSVSTLQPGPEGAPPAGLDRAVKKCLAKDPDQRWQTAADLGSELQWIAEGAGGAPVTTVPAAAPVPAPAPSQPSRKQWLWPVVASVLAVLALGLAAAYFLRPAPDSRVIRFTVLPPEKARFVPIGAMSNLAVSPDGRRLVFAIVPADGRQILAVRPLDSTAARLLPGTEGGAHPFWSPDGRHLAFFADGKLKRIELEAGTPPQPVSSASAVPRGGTWNRQGEILFSLGLGPIYRVAASGGQPAPVTTLATGEIAHVFPHFLPGGRRFLYSAGNTREIRVASLDSKETRALVKLLSQAAYAPAPGGMPGYLLYIRDRALVAHPFDPDSGSLSGESLLVASNVGSDVFAGAQFSASPGGVLAFRAEPGSETTQLVWLDRQGKRISVAGPPGEYGRPTLSPDGKTVALERTDPQSGAADLWLMDLGRGAQSRFTFDPGIDWLPAWSPDGTRIAFGANRQGRWRVYQKLSNGAGGEQLLLESADLMVPYSWSPDGRFLLYAVLDANNQYDLWALPMEGDRKPAPVLTTPFMEVRARLSPDGRWFAYASDETGRFEVYVQRFPGASAAAGGKWPVSIHGGTMPRWRADGKELFFAGGDGKLMAVEVRAEGSSFQAGAPRALFDLGISTAIGSRQTYEVSGDGQRFLANLAAGESLEAPIQVTVNWTAALRPARARAAPQ